MKRIFQLSCFSICSLLWAQADIDHAYLGVHTSRLDRGSSYQLGLPTGVHLQIEKVAPGSPAEGAGVKLYDVLLKLDDQLLINPEQLKTLVRLRNPGERISLSILRQAKPLSLSVELLEVPENHRDSYERESMNHPDPFHTNSLFGPGDRMRDFFHRHSFDFPDIFNFQEQHLFSDPRQQGYSVPPSTIQKTQDDPLHGDHSSTQSYSYSSTTQQITRSDEEGSMQWTEKDDLRFLRATDLAGQVLFEGSISSDEDREKLPPRVRERLQAMQMSGQIPRD
ncbi:MAG: PDZ domain-containing protein [Opitutales bacterium]|nr:PDZ domain-containing protein [Opitutales bacterium]